MPHATPVRDKIKYIDQKGENSDFVHWIYRDYVRCSRDVSRVLYSVGWIVSSEHL